jgi:CubicO group peptidase (beta-lactamase class C family)
LPPGRIFSYSNPGYSLAGFLIQEVAGKSYADLMVEKLFQPLSMNRTTFRPTVAMTFPLAAGHSESEQKKLVVVRPFAQDTRFLPAGYMYTSADDLSRFAIAFLNDGRLDGKEVLHPNVVRKMSQPYIDIPTDPVWRDSRYGYGLFLHLYRGVKLLEHVGSMPGFVAQIWMLPEKKIAVLVLANKEGRPFSKMMDKALELFVPLQPVDSPKPEKAIPLNEQEMRQYVGTYHNRWDIEVTVHEGKLVLMRFGSEMEVSKIGENRFSISSRADAPPEEIRIFPASNESPGFLQMFIWGFKKQ